MTAGKRDWNFVVYLVMIGVSFITGYGLHAWVIPWLHGAPWPL